MAIRRRKKKKVTKAKSAGSCVCGSCEQPHPHLRGYLLMALGIAFIPISFGFFPEYDWVAKGWPILLVLFGMVLVARAAVCEHR